MKSLRLHILIVLCFFLVTFIIGSFVDQQLSEAIFSRDNAFGLTFAVIGTLPGYACFAVLGGTYLWCALKSDYTKVWQKIIFYAMALLGFGCGIYFSGKEFFGPNGFVNEDIYFLGFIITTPIMCVMSFLGYKLAKQLNNSRIWIFSSLLTFFLFLALVPGVTLIKSIFHRPRYRTVTLGYGALEFHNWWERCKDYEEMKEIYGIAGEEFKSFPSGHAGGSAVFMAFIIYLPIFNKNFKKYQIPLFYAGFAWCLLVSFTRILVGAHFLSDVSMGAMLIMICLYICNEILIHLDCVKDIMNIDKEVETVQE